MTIKKSLFQVKALFSFKLAGGFSGIGVSQKLTLEDAIKTAILRRPTC